MLRLAADENFNNKISELYDDVIQVGLTQLNVQRFVVRRFIAAGHYSQRPMNPRLIGTGGQLQ